LPRNMRGRVSFWFVVFSLVSVISIGISSATVSEGTAVAPAFNMEAANTHWAFIPLQKPQVPSIGDDLETPVDAFIHKQLLERGLNPNSRADKRSLMRRVTYDLTGLPPTFKEVQSFLANDSPKAYEQLVDRLLASSAYGERWGRHWLDVARFADTEGRPNLGGNRYPYAHTYRDYVIDSFNDDKPFDRFILEQIAADLMDLGEDNSELAALGFLTLGKSFFGNKDFIIDDQIDVITRGLQGLTVTCARCHDHKFDPIPTKDYYSLHGVFKSSETPKELPVIRHPKNEADYQSYLASVEQIQKTIDIKTDEVVDEWLLNERSLAGVFLGIYEAGSTIDDKDEFVVFARSNNVSPELLRLWIDYLQREEGRAHPVLKDWFETYATTNPMAGIEHYNQLFKDALNEELEGFELARAFLTEPGTPLNPTRKELAIWLARKVGGGTRDLTKELAALEWNHPGTPYRAHVLADIPEPTDSRIYKRGDKGNLGEVVPRQFLEILSRGNQKPFTIGSGRLELARKLVDADNPLTARVFVNRVWGWHMGTPIVDTPSDFGVRTVEPIHIDLLNWLAASFIESGWSIKALHRMIVLSNTYQQSSSINPESMAIDSENILWHHFPKTRLDFESMRDTLLGVSGNLDRTFGGVPSDISDPTSNRRTVYSFFDRTDPSGVFRTFDHPSPDATSPSRFETVVPQQALFLMNSSFTIRQVKCLADRISKEAGADAKSRIRLYYQVLFQREATEEEIDTGTAFISSADTFSTLNNPNESNVAEGDELLNGWELYAQVLLLSNELTFLD
jgi:hypothetical protein